MINQHSKTSRSGVLAALLATMMGTVAANADDHRVASWTGFYFGIGVGARFTGIDWTTTNVTRDDGLPFPRAFPDSSTNRDYSSSGLEFNGFAGYNWQTGSVVVGIEGVLNGSGDSTSKTEQVFPGAQALWNTPVNNNTFDTIKAASGIGGSIRGRIGGLIRSNMLLYGTGGIAFQHFGFHADCLGSDNILNSSLCFQINHVKETVTKTGWLLGAGLEAQLTSHWFARIEYTYAGFDSADLTFKFADATGNNAASTMKANVDLDIQNVTAGVAYRF